MTDDLDTFLATPLPDVADNGFSLRVIGKIETRETWRERLTWGLPVLAACAIAPSVPLRELTGTVVHLGPALAGSGALSLAAGAIILTLSLEQRFRESQSAL
jgi:predicted cobalt transporter CbtA